MDRSHLPTRVIRLKPGDSWPDDDGFAGELTVEERIDLVWSLTVDAYAFMGENLAESRLQRHVVHLERGGR